MLSADQYKDKYFSLLGDSVSTLDGYNPPDHAVFYDWQHKCQAGVFTPEDTWWGQVIHTLGGRLLVNDSFSGSTVCKHPRYEIESYGCSDARTGGLGIGSIAPDVVMILLGINDWGCGMRITPGYGASGLSVFSVAYETMLEKIRRNYPETEIWCLTAKIDEDGTPISGAIRSKGIFEQAFGYFECRMKFHKTTGFRGALWMMCGEVCKVDGSAESGVEMELDMIVCIHSAQNNQCIGGRCPFYREAL